MSNEIPEKWLIIMTRENSKWKGMRFTKIGIEPVWFKAEGVLIRIKKGFILVKTLVDSN